MHFCFIFHTFFRVINKYTQHNLEIKQHGVKYWSTINLETENGSASYTIKISTLAAIHVLNKHEIYGTTKRII